MTGKPKFAHILHPQWKTDMTTDGFPARP